MTHKIYIAIYHVKMGAGKILLTLSDLILKKLENMVAQYGNQ